jgi:hypothetical protein
MWYSASMFFKAIRSEQSEGESLWEERLLLLEASSEDEARRAAELFGHRAEHRYAGVGATVVDWQFVVVERVYAIDSSTLTAGTELFSRFLRQGEVDSLLTPFGDERS